MARLLGYKVRFGLPPRTLGNKPEGYMVGDPGFQARIGAQDPIIPYSAEGAGIPLTYSFRTLYMFWMA